MKHIRFVPIFFGPLEDDVNTKLALLSIGTKGIYMYIKLNFVELFSLNLGIIFKGVHMQFEGTMNIENKNSIASFWNYTVNMILGVL